MPRYIGELEVGPHRIGPLADHVLVLPSEAPTVIGGLAVPQTQTERPQRGVVKAVGPGKITEMGVRIAPEVRVGDQVSFPSYAGGSVLYLFTLEDGVERGYLIVRQDELLFNHGPDEGRGPAEGYGPPAD